jgi:acyl-CoA synthetase (AMP-forming)/AMP-acid ligase II
MFEASAFGLSEQQIELTALACRLGADSSCRAPRSNGSIPAISAIWTAWAISGSIVARGSDQVRRGADRDPAEAEETAAPGAADAAVVARLDPILGEVPVAQMVPAGDQRPSIETCSRSWNAAPGSSTPKDVLFVGELPKSALGKVLRYRLRELVGSGS